MPTDTANLDGLLKRIYAKGEIPTNFNEVAKTYSKLKKSPQKLSGDGFFGPARLQGNEAGQGAINENEALRTPDTQVTKQWRILPKIFQHSVQISGLAIAKAKGNEDAFANSVTYQVEMGMKDAAKELNTYIFRDGSGQIAQVNGAVAAANTVVFDNGVGTHFRRGMKLDFYNVAVLEEANVGVLDIDLETNTLTLDRNVTLTDNDFIFRAGENLNAPTEGKEWTGLPLATDDGSLSASYLEIDRTTSPAWQGITIDAGVVNLSNDLLQRTLERQRILSNGYEARYLVSASEQLRKYLDIVTPLKRFTEADAKMDSGYIPVPTWNGKEWIVDTDCGKDEIYGIHPDYFQRYELMPLKFDTTDGKMIKWFTGFDSFFMYAKAYGNYASTVPTALFRLRNLAFPAF